MLKFNDLQMQKDIIQQQVDSGALEEKVLQSHLMVCKLNQVSKFIYLFIYLKKKLVTTKNVGS